ncbi:hypothetical protein BDZ89DRAFT_1163597 [Hymenopellis radicata]|nr:hypothetical protein BDZ89DRAFT_1163597 [Hymenopellis radicata]
MDSDLLDVGFQCAQNNCRQIDFLPIRCSCALYFCRDHILPDAHTCRLLAAATPHSSDPATKFQRCALVDCNKASLDAFSATEAKSSASCFQCHLAFCAEHRYPDAHSCSPQANEESLSSGTKNNTARALLAKHFPSNASESQTGTQASVPKTPTDPAKLAQLRKVQLMKMRHRATPADPKDKPTSVSVNDRLHIRLHVGAGEEKVYWVRKTIVTGKALDLLAQAAKIKTSPLRLCEVTEDRQLENSQSLASQIEDGALLMLRSPLPAPSIT